MVKSSGGITSNWTTGWKAIPAYRSWTVGVLSVIESIEFRGVSICSDESRNMLVINVMMYRQLDLTTILVENELSRRYLTICKSIPMLESDCTNTNTDFANNWEYKTWLSHKQRRARNIKQPASLATRNDWFEHWLNGPKQPTSLRVPWYERSLDRAPFGEQELTWRCWLIPE